MYDITATLEVRKVVVHGAAGQSCVDLNYVTQSSLSRILGTGTFHISENDLPNQLPVLYYPPSLEGPRFPVLYRARDHGDSKILSTTGVVITKLTVRGNITHLHFVDVTQYHEEKLSFSAHGGKTW